MLLATALALLPAVLPAATRPNVLVILTDDQGWGDLSLNGNRNLRTPHIDSLARDGARFSRFYVCPVCSPTRAEFLTGRAAIVAFLTRKWQREIEYRLIKEVWAFHEIRIAVRFAYEWRDDSGQWFRSFGNENWEFDAHGLMRLRIASINDLPISAEERLFDWPMGRRPDDHPGLSQLGL